MRVKLFWVSNPTGPGAFKDSRGNPTPFVDQIRAGLRRECERPDSGCQAIGQRRQSFSLAMAHFRLVRG